MVPVRFNRSIPFNSIHNLFGSLWEDDFFNPLPRNASEMVSPFAADIYEKDGAYVIKADMPGVDKKDVSIDLNDGVLTITARKVEEKETKEGNAESEDSKVKIYRRERFSGTFKRSFTLSDQINQEGIEAGMKDGVLEVTLPHSEKKEIRQITIN